MIDLLNNKNILILKYTQTLVGTSLNIACFEHFDSTSLTFLVTKLIINSELLIKDNVYVLINENEQYRVIYDVNNQIFYKPIDEIYGIFKNSSFN